MSRHTYSGKYRGIPVFVTVDTDALIQHLGRRMVYAGTKMREVTKVFNGAIEASIDPAVFSYLSPEQTPEDEAEEAKKIECNAAHRASKAGLGVSDWESFLTPHETHRLIILAEHGHGTWAREPETLKQRKGDE